MSEQDTIAAPPDFAERETLPPGPDDEAADRVMQTLLPPGAPDLVAESDSLIGRLIQEIAKAARIMTEERDDRRAAAVASSENQATLIRQQNEILVELRRTATATEANYALLHSAIGTLQSRDHEHEQAIHAQNVRIDSVLEEINDVRAAFSDRIDALERRVIDAAPRTTAS
jgi:exoribonuclease R